MKTESILHLISYIKAVEKTEEDLQAIGWDVEIPPAKYVNHSLHEVVLDLMGIPPDDEKGFVRDTYFDCFFESNDAVEIFNLIREQYKEFAPEYLKAGLIDEI